MALLATASVGISVAVSMAAGTTVPKPPTIASSTQFDITGFLQDATLDGVGTGALQGGTLTINGQKVIVPSNLVVILPASAMTWQELFKYAPAPYGIPSNGGTAMTGLALNDSPRPLTTYEVHVVGNRVIDANGDRMIAGMVHVAQQDLNSGAGYINYIDYDKGFLYIGGNTNDATTGTKVSINDPDTVGDANAAPYPAGGSGRFGRVSGSDRRFQVDQDNPTILAETGFPMCLPRSNPDGLTPDAECPEANRPHYSSLEGDRSNITPQPNTLVDGEAYRVFRMDAPGVVDNVKNGVGACLRALCSDPRKQAPFEIGDYVNFTGNLVNDSGYLTATQSPAPSTHVEAHTIVASLGIYTQPGLDPAYVSVDVSLVGTGGLTVFGAGEAAVRTRFEGMTTDESRMISLYGVDINPVGPDGVAGTADDGSTTDREWGNTMPDPGPPGGAVRGRWRFRPPCTDTLAGLAAKLGKGCTPPPSGQFIPPTQEVRAVIQPDLATPAAANLPPAGTSQTAAQLSQFLLGGIVPNASSQIPADISADGVTPVGQCTWVNGKPQLHPCTTANGIFYGQYHAPISEYIFPENVPGTAVPENNFNTIPFLAYGGYQSITGVQAGVLDPWPSNVAPPARVCAAPTMLGAPYELATGTSIKLSGSVTSGATTPVTLSWIAGTTDGGTNLNGALSGATTTTPTFSAAGLAAGTYFVQFSSANVCGVVTARTTIKVDPAPAPTINPIQSQTVTAGTTVTISATSPSLPAPTFTWTQTGGPGVIAGPIVAPSITFATTAAFVGDYTFSVIPNNGQGTPSATTVTVTTTAAVATPPNITFGGTLEYRISKQRLVMTATSPDRTITGMVLQPYLTESGTTFNPASLGANLVVSLVTPGSYTITLVGAPKPACNLGGTYGTPCAQTPITVNAVRLNPVTHANDVVGTSGSTAMQKIRQ